MLPRQQQTELYHCTKNPKAISVESTRSTWNVKYDKESRSPSYFNELLALDCGLCKAHSTAFNRAQFLCKIGCVQI